MDEKDDGLIIGQSSSAKKLRILWYAPWFASSRTRYLSTLNSDNFETKLVTSASHFDFSFGLPEGTMIFSKSSTKIQEIRNLWGIFRVVKEFQPNLILVDDLSGVLRLSMFILLAKKYPTTFVIDDVVNHDDKDKRSRKVEFLRTSLVKSAKGVLLFSENSVELARDIYPRANLQNVPLMPEVKPSDDLVDVAQRRNFAMIGRWSDYKGFDIGIDIFSKYRKDYGSSSELELWCSGVVSPQEDRPGIIWRSKTSYKWAELLAELPKYRGVLLPYRSATQSGVQVLAWQSGVPCVVSNLPGLLENQPQIKNQLNVSDYQDWFKIMGDLESNEYLQEVSAEGSRESRKSGSNLQVGLQLEKAISSFLERGDL
jgi:glycosyltransferase involved in cell wall biosynthesis